ncbi:LOW QUALITY PROTEIN: zinc finger protein 644 [Aulostomus maculatus]
MSDLKSNAREDRDVEPVSDSPGHTQEPLQSHTFSLKNNAAGLSSDEHENPLNGTQPNPFVYSSVPAVTHAGNSLPLGALVNGPGSHSTSEVHCVLNKGTVLSNNVLDATWQLEKDTSPEVLPPPSELQSDTWKNTVGPVVKTLATQPGVNTPLSHSEENESKLAYSTQSGDNVEQMHISQPLTKQTRKTRSRRDAEHSESSLDDSDDSEIRWDTVRECFVMHERLRTNNTHVRSLSDTLEKVGSLNHRHSGNHFKKVASKHTALTTHSDFKDPSRSAALHHVFSSAQKACNEKRYPEEEDNLSPKMKQLKTEQLEQDPLFLSCTICNVNFKQERHFHRHMMYHLGKHNQVYSDNVSQPFICNECGRVFCDSNSLMRHIIIHQEGLEEHGEKIKGLENKEFNDRGSRIKCDRPTIIVQHAKTRDNLKHYYFCEECNYVTLTQQALEAHFHVTHLKTHLAQYGNMTHTNGEEAGHVHFQCQMGFVTCRDKVVLERKADFKHLYNCKMFAGETKMTCTNGETAHFPHRSGKKEDIYMKKPATLNSVEAINSFRFKCCNKNTQPSLWKIDTHGELLLQPAETLDVATKCTCMEEGEKNSDYEAFGSLNLATIRNLKLDQNNPVSRIDPNSPSMRKMSAPLHNTIDIMHGKMVPRLSHRHQKQSADIVLEKGSEGRDNFSDNPSEARGSIFESSKNESNLCASRDFRGRCSVKDQGPRVLKTKDDGDEDCSDIEQLIIKEEYMETTECEDSPESTGPSFDISHTPGVEHKLCPYCPAMFMSGVGLSNHVRGHLHRVGLSYNARHMVLPEQVALQDQQQRVRKRIPTGWRKSRKVFKPETQRKHTCPLCWGWFDSKTGLSNHVRGHLKRIGRHVSCSTKSPLCTLNELLQDKKESCNILQIFTKRQFSSICHVPQRFNNSSGLFLHTGLPMTVHNEMRSPNPIFDNFMPKQEAEGPTHTMKLEEKGTVNDSSSTAVGFLKGMQESMELVTRTKQEAYATRKLWAMTKDCKEEPEVASVEPNWAHGYDYEEPRPGLKKKNVPSLNAEIYTLTCRFCDLVFKGPPSIQEDWIKHLQRHLQHTVVPYSGRGMVEVLVPSKNTNKHVS